MDNLADEDASNIVFFASNEPFTFNVPTDGEYKNAPPNTYFYVRSPSSLCLSLPAGLHTVLLFLIIRVCGCQCIN